LFFRPINAGFGIAISSSAFLIKLYDLIISKCHAKKPGLLPNSRKELIQNEFRVQWRWIQPIRAGLFTIGFVNRLSKYLKALEGRSGGLFCKYMTILLIYRIGIYFFSCKHEKLMFKNSN